VQACIPEDVVLIVTRSKGEAVMIGREIRVTVVAIRGGQVHLGFVSPREFPVDREEIYQLKHASDGLTHPTGSSGGGER
jgi:carbon storage regulator